jgi:hypothetical protein
VAHAKWRSTAAKLCEGQFPGRKRREEELELGIHVPDQTQLAARVRRGRGSDSIEIQCEDLCEDQIGKVLQLLVSHPS